MRERTGGMGGCFMFGVAAFLLALLVCGPARADAPTFSIDNSVEREQEYFPSGWTTVDTYTQKYSLDWSEKYSSRLSLDLNFEVEAEDIIRSQDVDDKTITPHLELNVSKLITELSLVAEDTIEYTNEFNTPRYDNIEYGVDLSVTPLFKLPAIDSSLQRVVDDQTNLVDIVEDKFEVSTGYEFGDAFNVDLSWKSQKTDDRILDNSDTDSHDWDFSLDYSQTYTPAFKVDFNTDWQGSREDTLNNAGTILSVDYEKTLENKLKLTLESFPGATSDLEFVFKDDFVADSDDDGIDLSVEVVQDSLAMGTMTEEFTFSRNRVKGPLENTRNTELNLNLDFAGAPYKYLDYSATFEIGNTKDDDLAPGGTSNDTVDQSLDLSVTVAPNPKATVETSYSWEKSTQNGASSGSARTFKTEATFEGGLLDIPNLTFEPSVDIVSENDIAANNQTDTQTVDLEFTYLWVLPENMSWEISPKYSWEHDETGVTRTLDLEDDFTVELVTVSWNFKFEKSSSFTLDFDDTEPLVWEHTYTFNVDRELTPSIVFDAEYEYKFVGDGDNTDNVEANLEWTRRNKTLAFKIINDRIFEGPQNVVRTFEIDFQMDF